VAWDFITLTPAILNKAARVDAVCYGTLGQRDPVSRATVRRFVEATRAECVRVCDVNIRMPYCDAEVLRWSMQQATIIKISDEELPVVFHLLGLAKAPEKPGEAAQALAALFPGCSLVAMTLGAKGSLLAGREGTVTHPGFRIAPVDTVGAGDAFTAGLLHAYLWCQRQGSDGLSPANVLKMAEVGNLCGSFVASQPAATPPLSPELIQRIADLLRADDPAIS
jgi:fructokinase